MKAEITLQNTEIDYQYKVKLNGKEEIFNVIIRDNSFMRLEFEFSSKYYTLNQLKMIAAMIPVIDDLIYNKKELSEC